MTMGIRAFKVDSFTSEPFAGDRVVLGGRAITVLRGELSV